MAALFSTSVQPSTLSSIQLITSTLFKLSTQTNERGEALNTWTIGVSTITSQITALQDPALPSSTPPSMLNDISSTLTTSREFGSSNTAARPAGSSSTDSSTPVSPRPSSSSSSLSAGAGAGIGIAVLILVLGAIAGIILLLIRKRRTKLSRAQAQAEVGGEKSQLDDTSVPPVQHEIDNGTMPFGDRQELEGWATDITLIERGKGPAELRAGPYSNRHELGRSASK